MLPTLPINTRLIVLSEVSSITSLRKTSIYQLIAAGELRPIKLGRKTVFSEIEIFDWVSKRLSTRNAGTSSTLRNCSKEGSKVRALPSPDIVTKIRPRILVNATPKTVTSQQKKRQDPTVQAKLLGKEVQ